jgi:hypothetical protein
MAKPTRSGKHVWMAVTFNRAFLNLDLPPDFHIALRRKVK